MDQVLRKNLWIVTLVSLALVAFFLASGTGALASRAFVSGDEPGPANRPLTRPIGAGRKATAPFTPRSADTICQSNVFDYEKRPCSGMITDDGSGEEGEDEDDDGVPTMCEGESKLIATLASSDPEWSFAMIQAEGKTMPYRAGDEVTGLGKVQRVGWRLVLVDASAGMDCVLDLYPPVVDASAAGNEPPSIAAAALPSRPPVRRTGQLSPSLQKAVDEGIEVVSASERNVDRGLVDQLIENSSELMSQARILPYEQGGVVQGFKLYGIRRDSLLGKLGLRNGDIINSIGGIEMTSPDQALSAYTKLRSSSNLNVVVTRRGRRQTLDFNIR